jgi:hypothetical protein
MWDDVRMGLRSGILFAVAMTVAAFTAVGSDIPPIVPALAASLTIAVLGCALRLVSPYADFNLTWGWVVRWVSTFMSVLLALTLLSQIAPTKVQFVCEPLVPWGTSIVLFGAFFSAWMAGSISLRTTNSSMHWLIPIMLSWIAPLYGFFHAPWFLAQSVVVPCSGRTIIQCLIGAVAMMVAALAGKRVANWTYAVSRN